MDACAQADDAARQASDHRDCRFPDVSREGGTGPYATAEYDAGSAAGLKGIFALRHCAGSKGIVGRSSGRSIFRNNDIAVSGKTSALVKLQRTNFYRSAIPPDDRSRTRSSSRKSKFLCAFVFQ